MFFVLFKPYYFGTANVVDILNPKYIEIVCIEDYDSPAQLWRKISRTQKRAAFIYTRYWPEDEKVPTKTLQETQILPFLSYIMQHWNNPQCQSAEDIRSFLQNQTERLLFS